MNTPPFDFKKCTCGKDIRRGFRCPCGGDPWDNPDTKSYSPVRDDDKIWGWLAIVLILAVIGVGTVAYWVWCVFKLVTN